MAKIQQSLLNLISSTLDNNSYGVEVRSDLFNSQYDGYRYQDNDGVWHRFLPVMITDIVGQYINVPNTNTSIANAGVLFDIFVGFEGYSDLKVNEFSTVQYDDTLNAIEELKTELLAKYHPLGTKYLYMGGEDSVVTINTSSNYANQFIYFKGIFKNTDVETIFRGDSSTIGVLKKDATHIIWSVTSGVEIKVPYTVNTETEITVSFSSSNVWTITNGTDTDSITNTAFNASAVYYLGHTTGLEAIVQRLVVENSIDLTSVDDAQELALDISTWESKSTITNSGVGTISSSSIENCILWSLDGNAVFGVGNLNPISDVRSVDGGALYQQFELELNVAISNDILFGNNFEYYLSFDGGTTYEQIYPVDRQHTLATDTQMEQYADSNFVKGIVSESGQDITLSFYYTPSKKINKLLKHIVSGTVSQNEIYTLKVQYPFFNVEYNVIVDSGGISPNINEFSTITLSFKRKDDILT